MVVMGVCKIKYSKYRVKAIDVLRGNTILKLFWLRKNKY